MLFDQPCVETIVAGGNGRVRGEDDFAGDSRNRGVEADAFLLHAHANRFQHGEGAVAFVQVEDAGRDAQGLESAQAADAEQQFLANADAQVAAIEPRRELAILRSIAFDVGVEQQKIAAADFYAPDFGADASAAGFDFNADRACRPVRWRLPSAIESTSVSRYSSRCQPLISRRWRKYPWP